VVSAAALALALHLRVSQALPKVIDKHGPADAEGGMIGVSAPDFPHGGF
jgi:hypothetical protein